MAWTEPMVERVGALWKDGVSAREIARTLADEFPVWPTRNAVMGVIHRNKFVGAGSRPKPPPKSRARKKIMRLANNHGIRFGIAEPSVPEGLPLTPDDDLRIPLAQRCTILDLTLNTCRWPVGEPLDAGFFYCGGPVVALGKVYCEGHCRRAWARTVQGR